MNAAPPPKESKELSRYLYRSMTHTKRLIHRSYFSFFFFFQCSGSIAASESDESLLTHVHVPHGDICAMNGRVYAVPSRTILCIGSATMRRRGRSSKADRMRTSRTWCPLRI